MTPSDSQTRPQIVTWYTIYAIGMTVLYLLVLLAGLAFFQIDPETFEVDPLEARVNAVVFTALGFVFTVIFGIAPLLPRRPWAWVYKIVTICLGLTSCCCLPATIPLPIFWLKPEVKQYYGMS